MRRLAFSLLGALSAFPAAASSIEVPTKVGEANSITAIACAQCPALTDDRRSTYVVPDIAPNTDRTEFKDVGGSLKIVRTEAWLGGSPVVFMSTPTEAQVAAFKAPAAPIAAGSATALDIADKVGEDRMTTAALSATATSARAASLISSPSRDFDGKAFQLRLH